MISRKNLSGGLGIMVIFAAFALAQQPRQSSTTGADPKGRAERLERGGGFGRHAGLRHRGGMRRLLRELNLTDEQRQQARAIMQRRLASTKSQREELFRLREKRIAGTFTADDEARAKALRQEMRASMEGVRAEMEALLTAEQKARLDQLKQERKGKMEERMKRRQEFLNKSQQ